MPLSSWWSFGGPPRSSELLVAALALLLAGSSLATTTPVGWPWVVAGAAVTVVGLGPVQAVLQTSGALDSLREWVAETGGLQRLLVVLAIAAVLLGAIVVFDVDRSAVSDFVNGSLIAMAGTVALRIIRYRGLAG